jgi:hypothetical protein
MSHVTSTAIRFSAKPDTVGSATIVRLPKKASERLPSRGQVAVHGSINGYEFETVLEPDGLRGHWLRVDRDLRGAAGVGEDAVSVELAPTRDWPEPDVPSDLAAALAAAPNKIHQMWTDITPMARWEWVRWVNATANPTTRERRVEVTISKMNNGKRRPCCFDLSACTDPSVSKNGKLRDPTG